ILWKKPSLALRPLRMIELILFGSLFGFWSLAHAGTYPEFRLSAPPYWFPSVMAQAISLPWVLLILLYGIFIPNTWRRCAAVVGAAAALPMLISLTTGLSTDATRGHELQSFWVPLTFWLALAAAVAIYGSHRIEVLRVEASNARRL